MEKDWIKRASNADFYYESLTAALDGLRRDKILTDIVLITQDGEELPAHRVVLMSSCRYFRQLFTGPESNQTSVVLPPSINADCMNAVLDFMYSGQVTLPRDLADTKEIMRTARLLDFDLFHRYVAMSLSTSVTPENFSSMWDLADEFDNEKLRNVVISFVSKDIQSFSGQKLFQELDVSRLKKILQSPCLEINTAKCVLMAVIHWQSIDPLTRTPLMEEELLPQIKFSLIPKNVLEQVLSSEPAVQVSRKLWKIIAATLYSRGKQVIGYQPKIETSTTFDTSDERPTRSPVKKSTLPSKVSSSPVGFRFSRDKMSGDKQQTVDFEDSTATKLLTRDKEIQESSAKQGKLNTNRTVVVDVQQITGDEHLSPDPAMAIGVTKQPSTKLMRAKSPQKVFTRISPQKPESDSDHEINILIMGRKKGGEAAAHCFSLQTCTWTSAVDIEEMLINNAAWASHGNLLYLAGGLDSNQNVLNTVLVYNALQNEFQVQTGRMNMARSSSSAAIIGWHLYVVGGLGHHRKALNHVERYDILLDRWEVVESLPYAGWDIGVAANDGKLWAMGGRARIHSDHDVTEWTLACYTYDPEVYQWTHVGNLPDEFSSTAPVITLYGRKIYALKHTMPSVMWSFELSSKRWHRLQLTSNSVLRRILAILPHEERLWVIDYGAKMVMFNVQMNCWDREYPFSRTIAFPLYSVIITTKC